MINNRLEGGSCLKHVILFENEKGGSGKTTLAEIVTTGFVAAGKKVLVLDADHGNHGYIRRAGPNSAIAVGWHNDAAAAEDFISENITGIEILIIDCGANFRASSAPVLAFTSELLYLMKTAGAAITRCGVASTNAAGTDVLMQAITAGANKIGNTIIIENDVDGSGSFSPGMAGNLSFRVRTKHIAPGLMALRLRRVEPLITILEAPSPRYTRATAWFARHILEVISQPPFSEMIGAAGCARLGVLALGAPGPLRFTTPTVKHVRDDALSANEAAWSAFQRLDTCSEHNAWATVTEYRLAQAAYAAAKSTS